MANIPDDMIETVFKLCTEVSEEEIGAGLKSVQSGDNPINFKKSLAHALVSMYCGKESADKAKEAFEKISAGGVPDEIEEVEGSGEKIVDLLQRFRIWVGNDFFFKKLNLFPQLFKNSKVIIHYPVNNSIGKIISAHFAYFPLAASDALPHRFKHITLYPFLKGNYKVVAQNEAYLFGNYNQQIDRVMQATVGMYGVCKASPGGLCRRSKGWSFRECWISKGMNRNSA